MLLKKVLLVSTVGDIFGGKGHELSWVGLSFHKCIGWLPLPVAAGLTPRARRLLERPV